MEMILFNVRGIDMP